MATTPWDDDDNRLGIPIAGVVVDRPRERVAPEPVVELEVQPEPELRAGDTDLGRPAQVAVDVMPLTDEDRKLLLKAAEEQAIRDLEEADELTASDPAILQWAGWATHPLAAAFLLGSFGALGLFLYSQVLSILANIATQPEWIQYLGYAALAILSSAILLSMMRLAILYVRLRRNRQLRLKGLEELQDRTRLRWLAHAKVLEAKSRLEQYLTEYPMLDDKQKKAAARVGVTPELILGLTKVKEELLDPARYASAGLWFDRFRDGFQTSLDQAAEARIKYWANRAMLVTAVSPNGLVDSISTTYFGFALLADLCQIYNLKAGRTGTAVLLGRVFFNAYLSGQLNDFEKLAEEQYDQIFAQGLQIVGAGVGSQVAGRFLGKVGAKATTGYLNRVMLMRLGRYACRLLRPVTRE